MFIIYAAKSKRSFQMSARQEMADVNLSCGPDKSTALHCAASSGSVNAVDVVQMLLLAGADRNLTDGNGHRPIDVIVAPSKFPDLKDTLERLLRNDDSVHLPDIKVSFGGEKSNSSSHLSSPENGPLSSAVDSASSLNNFRLSDTRASSPPERKEYPVDPSLPDIKNSAYSTDEFRMFSFKIWPCSRAYSHDWTECPFVHPGENARRRDPRKFRYSCVPCPDFRKGQCRRGDLCEYAHGVFECWLHPAQYRTRLCKDGTVVDSEEFEPEALVESGVAHQKDNSVVKMGLEERWVARYKSSKLETKLVLVAWLERHSCDSCKNDLENYCPKVILTNNSIYYDGTMTYGGYSDHMVATECYVVRIPDNLPLDACAPLLCAGITTYSPLRYFGLYKPGLNLGVVGLGGLGQVAVKFAKAFGLKVTVISTSPRKKKEAIEHLGADSFLISTDPNKMQLLWALWMELLTVSAVHSLLPLLGLLKSHGKLVLVGAPEKPFELPAFPLLMGRKIVAGSNIGGMTETQEMIDFAGKHNITADIEVIPTDYMNTAMERLAKADVKYRFVIDIGNTLKAA
ncbi:unnamed protein product [Camellia sinensis]